MPAGSKVADHLPFLRRYSRALTGSQSEGDALVRATVEAAGGCLNLRRGPNGGRIPLYAAFTRLWQGAEAEHMRKADGSYARDGTAHAHLAAVAPRQREALLLTALEQFSSAQTGQIMGISIAQAGDLADASPSAMARDCAIAVLIIEDEPIAAQQLEQIVNGMGLTISATAATRDQALQSLARHPPGLVLAGTRLADGGSGLDIAAEIRAGLPQVPVIFMTACPERLLTGDRPEPTYLLAKPFHADALRAAISQALFFAPRLH